MTEAPALLEKAAATMRERSAERDVDKERAITKAVALFNAQFGTSMTEYQGWMFMVHLKLSRAEGGNFREDDYIDAAAYIALAAECRGDGEPKPMPAPIPADLARSGAHSWELRPEDKQ